MNKTISILSIAALSALLGSAAPAPDVPQTLREKADARVRPLRPRIDAVSPEYSYPNAINLVLNGAHFPAKRDGKLNRWIRLAQAGGSDVFYDGGNRLWTAAKIETFLSWDVIPGRRYKAGITEWSSDAPSVQTLISNEVEFLLLINLQYVEPSPVPLGVSGIKVLTANALGPRGSKIVRFAGRQATITKWEGSSFTIVIPSGVLRPAAHELFVEDGGRAVSTKLSVKLLGPVIRGE
jgi:hypothetical protein